MIEFECRGEVLVARPLVTTIFEKETTDNIYKAINDELNRLDLFKLVVDFVKVESFSSNFIGMMVGMKKSLSSRGGDIRICCLNDRLTEIAEVTHLGDILVLFRKVDRAVASYD